MTPHTDEDTKFNFQVELSQLPVHVVKETEFGPVRIVGRSGFDTERARNLLRDDQRRGELLEYVGPMLRRRRGSTRFSMRTASPVSCARRRPCKWSIEPIPTVPPSRR